MTAQLSPDQQIDEIADRLESLKWAIRSVMIQLAEARQNDDQDEINSMRVALDELFETRDRATYALDRMTKHLEKGKA